MVFINQLKIFQQTWEERKFDSYAIKVLVNRHNFIYDETSKKDKTIWYGNTERFKEKHEHNGDKHSQRNGKEGLELKVLLDIMQVWKQ